MEENKHFLIQTLLNTMVFLIIKLHYFRKQSYHQRRASSSALIQKRRIKHNINSVGSILFEDTLYKIRIYLIEKNKSLCDPMIQYTGMHNALINSGKDRS